MRQVYTVPLPKLKKQQVQQSIEKIYSLFLQRVAKGRKKDVNYIDSIAQGRVWSGDDAIANGLVDRIGSLYDAVQSASRLAKLKDYGIREYPESRSWMDELLGRKRTEPSAMLKEQLGEEYFTIYEQMLKVKQMSQSIQARLPFEFMIN